MKMTGLQAQLVLCLLAVSFVTCSDRDTTDPGSPAGAADSDDSAASGGEGGSERGMDDDGGAGGSEAAAAGTNDGAGEGGHINDEGDGMNDEGDAGDGMNDAGGEAGGRDDEPGGADDAGAGGSADGSDGLPRVAGKGDAFVSDLTIEMHEEVRTILVLSWTQARAAEKVWLEFWFEDDDEKTVMTSRAQPGQTGPKRDVVLGVPSQTDVTVRVVSSQGGKIFATKEYQGTTGELPRGMPQPEVLSYNPEIASPERFLLGAVEDAEDRSYYQSTFWTYIIDRKGRVVWYFSEPGSGYISSFQRVARDGEYIWIDQTKQHDDTDDRVLKRTLDGEYQEAIEVTFTDCIDVTDDGSLLFDRDGGGELWELTRDGEARMIWSCSDHFGGDFACYTNTVNWNSIDDTVLMSYPHELTVVEVSRTTGALVGQYGSAPGSYAFQPTTWEFGFQHFANITKDGTLLISSHLPGNDTYRPVANEHAFIEFAIDRDNETLTEKWVYTEGPEWPQYKGMAIKLPNDNVLANYGTGGVIREITEDKQTAWHVVFPMEDGGAFYGKMVGHNVLIDDLYALNGGGPE